MSTKDDDLLVLAKERWNEAMNADRMNRDRGLSDAEFECDDGEAGYQWPLAVRQQRIKDGRPCLTVNRLRGFVRQVSNELRMQPPGIAVSAAEDGDVDTASVIEGLIRSIEQASKAKRVYARAGEDSARCNMGYWRVSKVYASDETFEQDLRIEPILNPFSVLFDPFHQDSTCRDARYCFVYDDIPRKEFEARFKGKAEIDFYSDDRDRTREWINQDVIRLAEYWTIEEEPTKLLLLSDGSTVSGDNERALLAAQELGLTILREREVKRKKVRMRLISAVEVLEDHEWEGSRIPIIPVWGEEARVGARRVRNGVITFAKDSQRMLNYWRSASVERMALAPKAPWLVTPGAIKGFEAEWKNAGQGNPSVLRWNPESKGGVVAKPERIAPAAVEVAMVQEAALASDDMKATTGIYDAALGAKSNETSGKAIIARQREGDVGTYAFIDNVMDAIEETGRVLIEMIPFVYDTPRQLRILGKRMEAKVVEVNRGQYDLTRGKYDVVVSTGPSVTTQRQETASILIETLQAAPMLAPVVLPRLAQVIELPDADEFAAEVKQMLAPAEPPPPDPKDQSTAVLNMAKAEGQQIQNASDAFQLGKAFAGGDPAQSEPDGNQGQSAEGR